jgi:hypothetical protein
MVKDSFILFVFAKHTQISRFEEIACDCGSDNNCEKWDRKQHLSKNVCFLCQTHSRLDKKDLQELTGGV